MTNPILVTNYLKLKAARILALVIEEWRDSHYNKSKSLLICSGPAGPNSYSHSVCRSTLAATRE